MGWIVRGALLAGGLVAVPHSAPAQSPDPPPSPSVDTLEGGRVLVRNTSPRRGGDAEAWELLETLRLGKSEGSGPDIFGDLHDIAVDARGNIYVVDGGWREVRVFDHQGRYLRRMAREGGGPGEKRYSGRTNSVVWEAPNRLWVSDGLQRLALDSLGNELDRVVMRSAMVPGRPIDPRVRVVAAEAGPGHSTVYLELTSYTSHADVDRGAPMEQYAWAARLRLSDEYETVTGDTLVIETMPISEGETRESARGNVSIQMTMQHPRDPRVIWGIGPGGVLWSAHKSAYRLHEITFAGDTIRTVELGSPPPVPGVAGKQVEYKPVLAALDVSPEGWLWVRREPEEHAGEDLSTWDLFDNCGRYRGAVAVPEQVRAVHIGAAGEVHAVVLGTFDISYVRRLRLESPAGASVTRGICPF